jgi:hypothetical protein
MKKTRVKDIKLAHKTRLHTIDMLVITSSNKHVINIENKDEEFIIYMFSVDIGIVLTPKEIITKKEIFHLFIPSLRSFI